MSNYKLKLRDLFEEHEEWDPSKSLGSQSEFGNRRICAACGRITDPIWDHDEVDEEDENYYHYDHDASWCSNCEDYFCGECAEENEGENTSRVWRCIPCAKEVWGE
jgi:hypothetical protein